MLCFAWMDGEHIHTDPHACPDSHRPPLTPPGCTDKHKQEKYLSKQRAPFKSQKASEAQTFPSPNKVQF